MFKRCIAAGLALATFGSGSAFATTSTISNFTVSVQITAGCTISATNINYGAMQGSVLLGAAQTSTAAMGGLFTYQCTANPSGPAPALSASTGANPNGTQARMKGVLGGFINYNLNLPAIAAFSGASQTAQITATIPTVTTAPAVDSYTDTVTLTLTY